jgi:hypothetical protein
MLPIHQYGLFTGPVVVSFSPKSTGQSSPLAAFIEKKKRLKAGVKRSKGKRNGRTTIPYQGVEPCATADNL